MGRRRMHRLKSESLTVPDELFVALDERYGPLDERKTVQLIAEGVQQLHVGLTRKRKQFIATQYMRNPALRMAYSTYTVCAQAPKLQPILNRLPQLTQKESALRIAEFGCGPGTGVAAFGLWARRHNVKLEHLATDHVPAALESCQLLANDLGLDHVETLVVDLKKTLARQLGERRGFDVILMMNVLNEIPKERFDLLTREFKRLLNPDGFIILIEPASMDASRHLLEAREVFIEHEWSVVAPCTHQSSCPMLEAEQGWCHDTWPFERPEFMKDVDQIVGTRRDSLKASWLVLKNEPATVCAESVARVVSERFIEKGRERVRVCAQGQVFDLELQSRDKSDSNHSFSRVNRYDLVQFNDAVPLARGLRLGPDSQFQILKEDEVE